MGAINSALIKAPTLRSCLSAESDAVIDEQRTVNQEDLAEPTASNRAPLTSTSPIISGDIATVLLRSKPPWGEAALVIVSLLI